MKLIVAIIKPHKVEDVTEALHDLDISGVTLSEVRGHGRQGGHTEVYRGAEYKVDYVPKVKVEILVEDSDTDKVANALARAAHTGNIGDGKIWIVPVEAAVRIRTGEVGSEAL